MRIGRLNKTITLQSPGGSRDAVGERTTTWTNVATIWAGVEPLSARELFAAGQAQSAVSHRVVVRYASEIAAVDHTWRIIFGVRVLIIDAVRNVGERNDMIELLCTEGIREE